MTLTKLLLGESLPISNKAKEFSNKIKQSQDKESLQKELDSMFKAKEITASEFDELSANIGRLKVNKSYSDDIAKMLDFAVTTVEKIIPIASAKLSDGKRLSRILTRIANELQEEVMFVKKGEYND